MDLINWLQNFRYIFQQKTMRSVDIDLIYAQYLRDNYDDVETAVRYFLIWNQIPEKLLDNLFFAV